MVLFKKESIKNKPFMQVPNENIPLLPELPESKSLPELPSLPEAPEQEMINAANESYLPEPPEDEEKRTMEIDDSYIRSNLNLQDTSTRISGQRVQKAPIFVKIEKFQEAIKKFEEIKTKIKEIEVNLEKIKEIKSKEEKEIDEWENEMRAVKEKISAVDSSIFNPS